MIKTIDDDNDDDDVNGNDNFQIVTIEKSN